MTEYVRVSDSLTGHHYTTSAAAAAADPTRYRVLKQAALDANGVPLPPKFKTTVASATGDKSKAAEAAEAKEAN